MAESCIFKKKKKNLIMVIKIINNVAIISLHCPLLIMDSSPSPWITGPLPGSQVDCSS